MDQDITNSLRVRVLEKHSAVTSQREHSVRVLPRRQPARELEPTVDKHPHRLFELGLGGAANYYERQSVSLRRFARRSGTPSATMSSTAASRMACTDPKCRSSARLRAGPMPSTESRGDVKALRARTLRWCVIANRWASSRIRWTRNIPGEFLSWTMGSERLGANISSRSLASAKVGMSA